MAAAILAPSFPRPITEQIILFSPYRGVHVSHKTALFVVRFHLKPKTRCSASVGLNSYSSLVFRKSTELNGDCKHPSFALFFCSTLLLSGQGSTAVEARKESIVEGERFERKKKRGVGAEKDSFFGVECEE
jgi:hypothetical protein